MRTIRLSLPPTVLLRVGIFLVILVSAASIIGNLLAHHADRELFPGFDRLVALVDVDQEGNLPAWFSASLLLIAALLLWDAGARSALAGDGYAHHWKLLAVVFLFLSFDETAQIHETANALRGTLDAGGLLFLPWVLVAAPLVLLLGLGYLRFVLRLPARTRMLVAAAGALYVGGALGVELIGGYVWDHGAGYRSAHYIYAAAAEELLEMLGLVTFLYAVAARPDATAGADEAGRVDG